ncbi:hypothetical protein A2291_06560 [candidate division WOR-1 bacterium RIFOXYB2_FULL_42_35]|uniref:AMP-dependent synthetase/ligase domain-containing protein n=1 Tax=candidate division WOR-1 bacterium RIFOXYC2_FULL_41_25 TaxID=1802586 RepID=A0A1F4TPN7_UNCSA|nr:MAG: hypothetical protein A2291_06560 [candidate division WOR-1 bacterium RIFOXYB2_FULL_42_35]OGC24542.1 MAG: hypothetical protein A2247_06340 [candidate division WOR-1 bacterium RIFOXYA2_FULL_41_14]OGC34587.1 MAG: hypothetical protein A2462_04575 [candidate division WOR-1 bacterium RIFOXYC2_FULL_41_25]OGC44073.1 MAG: hypothetical protein A2548_07140 [candidate division WOR-1 bacterium RIFOXYD2_FULL_41_8]
MEIITIKQLLEESVEQYRNQVAFQIRQEDRYLKYTYQEVALLVRKIQAALVKLGIKHGDRVALLSENRPEWPISFLAITSLGAVVVPLDAMLKPEEVSFLLGDCGAKVIILGRNFSALIKVTGVEISRIFVEDFDRLATGGEGEVSAEVSPDDLASIVYTSGTTGVPKGVMLTHKNIMSDVSGTASLFDFGPGDTFLSVLPLQHTFETTAGFLGPFSKGASITYAESLKSNNILRNMKETDVTIMCGVPLLYQVFYDGILREVEAKNKTRVFSGLLFLAKAVKTLIGINIGKYFFSVIHKKFGGKIRFFVSGGAALDPQLARNFELLGFTLLQGYGLSESAPVLTCNTLKNNRLGSVGKAIPGVEIKIAGTELVGEILAFGPNIMKGYYKQKELSSRVLINGWLYTGDVGYLDEDGYLFITGRSKDIIVTSSGVNVYPEELEFLLSKSPLIAECCVLGEKVKEGIRKGTEQVVAVIVPDQDFFKKIGETSHDFIKRKLSIEIQQFNRSVADCKRIAKFIIRNDELPKTRLKKVKRHEVEMMLNDK